MTQNSDTELYGSAPSLRIMPFIIKHLRGKMAERVGFEPTVEFPRHSLSRRAPSTARTPLPRKCSHSSGVGAAGQCRAVGWCSLSRRRNLRPCGRVQAKRQEGGDALAIIFVACAETVGQFSFFQANHDQGEGPPEQEDQPE